MAAEARSLPKSLHRSAETRLRLIEAALDLFGQQGFEGTTTRQLAERAKVNLAAIPYHFGSKERLYQAVADHIAEQVRGLFLAGLSGFDPDTARLTPQTARDALHMAVERLGELLMSPEADRWARFIMRELMMPSAAFETFYKGAVEPAQTRICALIKAASARDYPEKDLRVQGLLLFGQTAIFRLAQPVARRRLDCKTIGPEELARIKRMLHGNIDAILNAGRRS